ncbi:MAG: tRNA(Ile)-lysidine synthetase, partial [Clostridia bacterium]|nr:tRNA(Ile)-lysidine synthetase [Clostridia bacterium]
MLEGFDYGYLEKFDRLALAVSGGKDSMALLHTLLQSRKRESFFVVTVHHNLRGEEGKRDRDFVTDFCKQNQIECLVFEEDVAAFCSAGGYTIE